MTDTTGTTTYAYDAANRLTSIELPDSSVQTYTWDARGNLLSTGAFTYTYNAAGRMVRAASQDLTSVYTYTADGLRVAQAVDGAVTAFAWDWATGVPELLTDGGKRYLVGHDTLGWEDAAGWTYAVPDALGSVRQAVDGSGSLVAAREWSPYGVEIGDAQAGLGYTGEWWDAAVGLQYLRARWYAPALGLFTSSDPLGFPGSTSQSSGAYRYAGSDPINYLDPMGLWRWWGTSSLYHLAIEHWYEYQPPFPPFFNPMKQLEYPIPGAFWMRPDMFNSVTGDVYEIEPWYKYLEGAVQVKDYVGLLNIAASRSLLKGEHLLGSYDWNNVYLRPGIGVPDWPGKLRLPDPRYPYLDIVADYYADGVVLFWHEFNSFGYAIVAWRLGHLIQVANKDLLRPKDWQPPLGQVPQLQPAPAFSTIVWCGVAKGVVVVGGAILVLNVLENVITGGVAAVDDVIVVPAGLLLIDWGQKQAALLPVEDMAEPQ